jgi:hypothetical protein
VRARLYQRCNMKCTTTCKMTDAICKHTACHYSTHHGAWALRWISCTVALHSMCTIALCALTASPSWLLPEDSRYCTLLRWALLVFSRLPSSPSHFPSALHLMFSGMCVHIVSACRRVRARVGARACALARVSVQPWFRRRPFFSSRSESEPDSTTPCVPSIGDFRGACKRTENGNCKESI